MTDNKIEENAERYAETYVSKTAAYIGGAHSRDDEISRLGYINGLNTAELVAKDAELQVLRNQWISVEDMLPDEFKKVIVMFDSGIIIDAFMTMVKDEPAWHPSVEIPIGSDVIFWMPIPELKKGGKK